MYMYVSITKQLYEDKPQHLYYITQYIIKFSLVQIQVCWPYQYKVISQSSSLFVSIT